MHHRGTTFKIVNAVSSRLSTAANQPARLKDLAEMLGLSVSGVSRALSGHSTMALETRLRVRELATRLGYQPVAAARALRGMGTAAAAAAFRGTIAYIVQEREIVCRRSPGAEDRAPWLFGVERHARSLGYAVDILPFPTQVRDEARLARILSARGICGVVISAEHNDLRQIDLGWQNFAALTLSASPSVRFLTNLSVPYFQDTYFAVSELVRRGYHRIGFVMIGNILDEFLSGYQTAVNRFRLPVIKPLVTVCGVPSSLDSWIAKNRLDVVLTTTGLELLEAIRVTGRKVPEDLGLCCVDDIDAPGILSGLHQPRQKLANLAVDILDTMIQRNEHGIPSDPMEVHLPSSWSEGTTLLPGVDQPSIV